MTPAWSISADGSDVTARLADYLVKLSITDRAGIESDEMSLEIADPDAVLEVPRLGAVLDVAIGYEHSGIVPVGGYTVDSVEISSPPRRFSIRGHAADQRDSLKTRRSRGWEGTTLGEIVETIAARHNLAPAIDVVLADWPIVREDQTGESDLAFLTRLGQGYGAVASVKAGRLVFARRGQATSVSGTAIQAVALVPADVTNWRISYSDSQRYTAVEARYYDVATATETWTRAGTGDGEAVLRLRQTYPDERRATAAADAKLSALERGQGILSLTLPGRVELAAETPIELSGFGVGLDGDWVATSATHSIGGKGFQTSVEAEQE